ncbi:MAG: hypothetical protein IJ831_02865 [Spirochaetales bacterium]|nr:hypothetical protein [Spirochaetales bacterium]
MQSEVIEQILQAEKRAEEIVSASDSEARRLILDAQSRAAEMVRRAEKEKKAENERILSKAQEESSSRIAEYRRRELAKLEESASSTSPRIERASDEALDLVCRVDLLEARA